jgi:hypothetical protein
MRKQVLKVKNDERDVPDHNMASCCKYPRRDPRPVEIFVATSTHACHNTYWPWITPRVFTARSHVVIWNVAFIVFLPSILVFAYALTCAMQFYQ